MTSTFRAATAEETLLGVQNGDQNERPRTGLLTVLPTKAEIEARFKPIQAYVTTVAAKRASTTLRAVDSALKESRNANTQPLQHLRRYVKSEHLPKHLGKEIFKHASAPVPRVFVVTDQEEEHHDSATATNPSDPKLHLLVCATSDLTPEHIQTLLASDDPPTGKEPQPTICTITVPGLPPSTEAEAKQWSREYWPTIYKKHNPFGAHPAIVSRATAEIEGKVGDYMGLARTVGQEVSHACIGEDIGVVVIDRNKAGKPSIAMVAGDARWSLTGKLSLQKCESSNVMAHAVMRAIGLIARKRQDVSFDSNTAGDGMERDAFTDVPLTPLERAAYAHSSIEPGGYLCLGLEFYLTHEPCVMCSMALLHSRVGRVIFAKRMQFTGALTAGGEMEEPASAQGLGYGLFWRSVLNWKFLTWQWRPDDLSFSKSSDEKLNA